MWNITNEPNQFSLLVSGCSMLKNSFIGKKRSVEGGKCSSPVHSTALHHSSESILYNPVSLSPDFLFIKKVLQGSIEALYFFKCVL